MSSFNKAKEPGKPTVFLVQENPYINVLGAAEYGDIVVLFESGQQIMFSPQPAIRKLKRKLRVDKEVSLRKAAQTIRVFLRKKAEEEYFDDRS